MEAPSPTSDTLAAVVRCVYQFAHDPAGWLDDSEQWLALSDAYDLRELPAELLTPHLQAVEQLAQTIAPVVAEPSSPLGVIYFNRSGQLLRANAQAESALAPLQVSLQSGQTLSWPGPEGLEALGPYLDDAQRSDNPVVVQFRALGKIVLGLLSRSVQQFGRDGVLAPPDAAAFALLLPGAPMMDESISWLQARGLTNTESIVAMRIGSGLSPQEVAGDMGTSINTVRTHVRAIFEKLGVNRQGELVKAISDLAAISQWLREPAGLPNVGTERRMRATNHPRVGWQLPDGRQISYRDYGVPGHPAIVFFHSGWGQTLLRTDQQLVLERLQMRWIAVERPGFGETTPASVYNMATATNDLTALLGHLQLEQCVFLGAASGVRFALQAALQNQQGGLTPLAVIGVAPRVGKSHPGSPETANLFVRQYLRMARNPALIESLCRLIAVPSRRFVWRRMLSLAFGEALNQLDPLERDALTRHAMESIADATGTSTQGISDELSYLVQQPRTALEELLVPIQFWHGEDDEIVSVRSLEAYAAEAPDSRLVALPGPNGLLELVHFEPLIASVRDLFQKTPLSVSN
ncbi:MAG: alpha/beta fold hydrolase [Pseudomonadales bacterium]